MFPDEHDGMVLLGIMRVEIMYPDAIFLLQQFQQYLLAEESPFDPFQMFFITLTLPETADIFLRCFTANGFSVICRETAGAGLHGALLCDVILLIKLRLISCDKDTAIYSACP